MIFQIIEDDQIEPIQTVLTLQDLHTISHMVAEHTRLFVPEVIYYTHRW